MGGEARPGRRSVLTGWQAEVRPIALVGLKAPGTNRGVFRGQVLIGEEELAEALAAVHRIEGVVLVDPEEQSGDMPVHADGRRYPATLVHLSHIGALEAVRELQVVDYVEPLYFQDGIGCIDPTYGGNPADESFTPAPGRQQPDTVPWNFRLMGIQDAWGLFNDGTGTIVAPGRGITIGIVDTGIDPNQPQLNQLFPLPTGTRSPARRFSVTPDATVRCSHGTRMAGLATAPADGTSTQAGNFVGVAWGSDLVSVKIGDGVVQLGVTTPTVVAGLDKAIKAGARVITMAFGLPYVSDFLRDSIVRMFTSRKDVLFIAAAGTFVPGVIFPASMDTEVIAVTIVRHQPTATVRFQKYLGRRPGAISPEDLMAYGPLVDFAAVNGPGDIPTTGMASTPVTTIGGTSSGTAMIAGIAALAWSRLPHLTRSQIIDRLAAAASVAGIEGEQNVVSRSLEVGFGIPDAYVAAGGARRADILGPRTAAPGSTYTLTATTNGYPAFFTYKWDSGETTQAITAIAGGGGIRTHSVTITNVLDATVIQASLPVVVGGVHLRRIFAEQLISEWATFLNGKRVDHRVNGGSLLPSGCSVHAVAGLEYVFQHGTLVPSGSASASQNHGNRGFTITRPGGLSPDSLEAIAHVWHDGLSAICVRVAYDVWEPDGMDCVQPGITRGSP